MLFFPPSDRDLEASMTSLVSELQSKYPGHILPTKDLQWSFINRAGWMASICILHASLTEYVALLGTAMETSGHSGKLSKKSFMHEKKKGPTTWLHLSNWIVLIGCQFFLVD